MNKSKPLIGLIAFSCAAISSPVWAEGDARSLLQQCLPETLNGSYRSRVSIDITHKSAEPETHHYTRLNDSRRLLLTPESQGGYGLFRDEQKYWLYNANNKTLEAIDKNNTPAGLLSETLLDAAELETFELTISSHNTFGGQNYYTVTATRADTHYPKRSLSFKQGDQQCNLIRAAYFDANNKLSKKLFFQWQIIDNDKLLKAIHVEDVHTLEAVRYHIKALEPVKDFAETDWPVTSAQ